jgi:Protein of unknown function (DUF3175)
MATRKKATRKRAQGKRWSQRVTQTSDALTLDRGVFARDDPRSIARSLKRSAERSRRRKAGSYASAMSMLTFYINRAGRQLPASRKRKLTAAKRELRALYGKGKAKKEAK